MMRVMEDALMLLKILALFIHNKNWPIHVLKQINFLCFNKKKSEKFLKKNSWKNLTEMSPKCFKTHIEVPELQNFLLRGYTLFPVLPVLLLALVVPLFQCWGQPWKQDLTFHPKCLPWRQIAWTVKFCFLGKIRKIFQNVVCWKFDTACLAFSFSWSAVLWCHCLSLNPYLIHWKGSVPWLWPSPVILDLFFPLLPCL